MLDAAFFAAIRSALFKGSFTQRQVDGLNAIGAAWETYGDGDPRKLAYVFATAFHETAQKMQPVTEYGSLKSLRSKPYWPFIGRGLVQLTWEENYRDWSNRTGEDLVGHPEKALEPALAARILVEGMKLGTFT